MTVSHRSPLKEILARCESGDIAVPMAAMHLLMQSTSVEEAQSAVSQAIDAATSGQAQPDPTGSVQAQPVARLQQLAGLLARHPRGWDAVHGIIGEVTHQRAPSASQMEEVISHWATLFDKAVAVSPEASVALYSLGDPDLLARITAEVVAALGNWGVLGSDRVVLDVGCGIGRVAAGLSPLVSSVIGIDISQRMLAEARSRYAGLPNVRFEMGSGQGLGGVADESVGLVIFVDSFPYVMLSGMSRSDPAPAADELAERYVMESARVLCPGGSLVVFNVSYRGDPVVDLSDLRRFADKAGLQIQRAGEHPCPSWDALVFQLGKPR